MGRERSTRSLCSHYRARPHMPKRGPIVPLPQKPKAVPKPKAAAAPAWHFSAAAAPASAPASEPKAGKKKHRAAEPLPQKKAGSGAGPPVHAGKKAGKTARENPEDVLAPAVLEAEGRCWDPDVAHEEGIALPGVAALSHELLAVEARRVAGLRRLRLSFGEATRRLQLRTPGGEEAKPASGAFERWHFGWLLSASTGGAAADPLLPLASSAAADVALSAELELVGATPAAAAAVVAALSRDAMREAAAMAEGAEAEETSKKSKKKKKGKHTPEAEEAAGSHLDLEADLALSTSSSGLVQLTCAAAPGGLKLAPEHLAKLRAMHARVRQAAAVERREAGTRREAEAEAEAEETLFCTDLARLLLRYKAIGGSGLGLP